MKTASFIVKPTKQCNARCLHCSSNKNPSAITLEDLAKSFNFLKTFAIGKPNQLEIIWHGGEPLVLPPSFYFSAHLKIADVFPKTEIRHSIQTNLLLYSREWKPLFRNLFKWRVSSSYDFHSSFRQMPGGGNYYEKWVDAVKRYQDDSGGTITVITVLSKENYMFTDEICESAMKLNVQLKLNPLQPVGRGALLNELLLSPNEYLQALFVAFKFWKQNSSFSFYQAEAFSASGYLPCPYTNNCFGYIYGLEPNGDIYQCSECADIDLNKFGNAISGDIYYANLMSMKSAEISIPKECLECGLCGGGCKKERYLHTGSLQGKTLYCSVWKKFRGLVTGLPVIY